MAVQYSRYRRPSPPPLAKLISGLILASSVSLEGIQGYLEDVFGKITSRTETRPFVWTRYYQREMGEGLERIFLAFDTLVTQDCLTDMKYKAMSLEDKWRLDGRRQVNIDPGILTAERLVLATTKNFTHRIYLDRGIFADLTLVYKKGGFMPLEWTYPDYRQEWSLAFWDMVRRDYLLELRKLQHDEKHQGEVDA